jgi:hypothetical protein
MDRDAVERVLRRATELSPHDDDVPAIDAEAVVEAASEAGIPAEAVRQSLAIERLGPTTGVAKLDRVIGPHFVYVERTVTVEPDVALDRLAEWLKSRHYLRQERSLPGEMTWSKRKGLAATALRSTRSFTGEGRLGDVRLLRAQAVDIDEATSLVRVSIDRTRNRRGKLAAGSLLGAGSVVAFSGAVMATPIALAGIPIAAASIGVARSGHRHASALERELLRLLDAVEHGRGPRSSRSRNRSRSRSRSKN